MRRNLSTHLRQRRAAPMRVFDRLPVPLRHWLAQAALPWSAVSALRLWHKALLETGNETLALARLSAREAQLLARDAPRVWGPGHPAIRPDEPPSPTHRRPGPKVRAKAGP